MRLKNIYYWLRRKKNMSQIKKHCDIGEGTFLKDDFFVEVRICEDSKCVQIGAGGLIRGHIVIDHPGGFVKIGNNCNIGFGCSLISSCGIEIGNNVVISTNVIFWDNDAHSTDTDLRREDLLTVYEREVTGNVQEWREKIKNWDIVSKAPIVIEDDVWIGFDVVILKGVKIGKGAVIGCRSVVTHDVPEYAVVAGNPARAVKMLNGENKIEIF